MHPLFYLLVLTKVHTFNSIPIDNGVEGEPIVNCGANEIEVSFKTRNAFQGRLYVKGQSNSNDCQSKQIGRKFTGINVLFDACNVQRLRSLNPRGIFALTTLVLTFHPTFLTKIDRTYRIVCFYMEVEKKLDDKLEVADLTTSFITQQVPMPICRYDILNGHPNGEPIHFGVVGQQVYHKFSCDSETIDTFCMLINSCFVEAQDRRVDILDTHGCAIDKFVLNDLEYISDLQAGQEAHVFKFADKSELFFQCQVNLKLKEPQSECERPICSTKIRKRQINKQKPADLTVDVSSPKIQIVDLIEVVERRPNHELKLKSSNCISMKVIGMSCLFLIIWFITFSFVVFIRSRRRKTYIVQNK